MKLATCEINNPSEEMFLYAMTEKVFSLDQLNALSRFYRANLINSISGYKSATLIATQNAEGLHNLAIFSNIVHLGADPALIGFVNRPLAAAPHTISNIRTTGYYSMNLIPETCMAAAHQTSAKYADSTSEFEAVGLTPVYKENSPVPLVKESPVQLLLRLQEIIPITTNHTFFVIGAVEKIWVEETLIEKDGFVNISRANILTSLGIDAYATPQQLTRFAYAKPDLPPQILD